MGGTRRQARVVGFAVVALCVGCGSTVPPTRLTPTSNGLSAASTPQSDAPGASVSGPRAGPGPAGGVAAPESSTSAIVSRGGASSVTGSGATVTGGALPAGSHAPVEVGFVTEASDAGLAGSLGLSGVSNGNEPAYMNAVVADVNAAGGILGHPVKPIESRLNPSSTETYSIIEQRECATFVDDHNAVAALTAFHNTVAQTLAACMEQHRAVTINPTGYEAGGTSDYGRFPHYFTPPGLMVERQAAAYIDGVNRQGFFHTGVRIGLISLDAPVYHAAVDHALIPALAGAGFKLFDAAYYANANQTSDIGPIATQIADAELRFVSEHIGEVLFLEPGALGVYEFSRTASSQGYHPRYAISTTDVPNGLIGLGTPADQLANMIGVGWMPLQDVGSAQMGAPLPPMARCYDVMKRARLESTDDTVRSVQLEYCEELWFLKSAVEAGGGFTAEQIRVGVERLTNTFGSPQTPSTLFGVGRHDGVDSIRPLRYLGSCSCFRYTGPPATLP